MKIDCAHDKIVPVVEIQPNPKNYNKHPDKQIKMLAKIINYQGQRSPIVVSNRSGFVVKGHGRLQAIKELGWDRAAVDYQDYENEAQEYADMVADNKIAELADPSEDEMIELIKATDIDDLELFGLDDFELPKDDDERREEIEDDVPEVSEAISKLGDIYELGDHRLLCGDSTDADTVHRLMNGEKADMVFTDPPYGVDYSNANRPKPGKDLGKIKNDSCDLNDLLPQAFKNLDDFSSDNSAFYIWYADKTTLEFYGALKQSGIAFSQMLIWRKPMLLGRNKYQYAYEPCIFAIKGSPYHTNDRKKTTVWDFGGYDKSKNVHPTQKPVVIPEEAISNSSKAGQSVIDLFGGSGSTLIACEKTGRKCYMMELDPHYIDVIVSRYVKYTGRTEIKRNGEPMEWTYGQNGKTS